MFPVVNEITYHLIISATGECKRKGLPTGAINEVRHKCDNAGPQAFSVGGGAAFTITRVRLITDIGVLG